MRRKAWAALTAVVLCLLTGPIALADGECEVRIYPGAAGGGPIMEWVKRQGWSWPEVKKANPALFGDWLDNPERPLRVYSPACAVEPSALIIRVEDSDPNYNLDAEALTRYLQAMGVRRGMIIVRLTPEALWWHHLAWGFIPTHFLAQGVKRMSEEIAGSESFALHVKGLEFPAFDPRTGKGFALGEAVANRGGDHLSHLPNFELFGMTPKEGIEWFGNPHCVDPYTEKGKVPMVLWHEYFAVICDSAEICKYTTFATYALLPKDLAELISYDTGEEWSEEELMEIGERVANLERLFNLKRGMDPRDDTLPARFLSEPLKEGPAKGIVVRLEEMLPEYYRQHGWDERGHPKKETLERLGIEG